MVRVLSASVSSVAGSAQASGAVEPLEPPAPLDTAADEDPAAVPLDAVLLDALLLLDAVPDDALLDDAVSLEEPQAASRTTSDDPAATNRRR